VHDEKIAFHIRSFHSSILQAGVNSPSAERFTFPLDPAAEPRIRTGVGHPNRCAERKAGVGAMRDYKVTFLWMSELNCSF